MFTYDLTRVTVACPACRATEAEVLYSLDAGTAARHHVIPEVEPERHGHLLNHIRALWGQDSCSVLRCLTCGFAFPEPHVAGDGRFFDLAFVRNSYPGWKWEFEKTRQVIASLQQTGSSVKLLEIGAGDGAFLRGISPELVPPEQIICTEYSEYGLQRLKQSGFRCQKVDFRHMPDCGSPTRFNVLCLFQVLQHLAHPDETFDALGRLSESGAHLFIAVPNEDRIVFNEQHGTLLDLPPNHVGRWTRKAFEHVASRHNWRLVRHIREPEAALSKARSFIAYRYLRKRQESTTLANRVERIGSGPMRQLLRAALAATYALASSPSILQLSSRNDLGDSQWVHLQRT